MESVKFENSTENTNSTATVAVTAAPKVPAKLLHKLEQAEAAAAEIKAEVIALLPLATPEQLEYECELVRSIRVRDADKTGVNKSYRLDEIQRAELAKAKAEHRKEINTAAGRKLATATLAKAKTLSSFKLKQGKKGLTFALSGTL